LIRARAPVDARNPRGRTPLLIAVDRNHLDLTLVLMRIGASKNAQAGTASRCSPLHGLRGQADVVRLIDRVGACGARSPLSP
jgi:ankyrin repeat protein